MPKLSRNQAQKCIHRTFDLKMFEFQQKPSKWMRRHKNHNFRNAEKHINAMWSRNWCCIPLETTVKMQCKMLWLQSSHCLLFPRMYTKTKPEKWCAVHRICDYNKLSNVRHVIKRTQKPLWQPFVGIGILSNVNILCDVCCHIVHCARESFDNIWSCMIRKPRPSY